MRYVVTIDGRTFEIDVDGETVLVDGKEHQVELRQVAGIPVRNLLIDGRSWIVPLEAVERGVWLAQSAGERFEVEVIDERTRHIRSLVGAGKGASGPSALKAPMPGLVVRITAEPGQTVAAGQGLLVLEAMKMENELKAAVPGVVDQIMVKSGQAVEKGAVLITFRT